MNIRVFVASNGDIIVDFGKLSISPAEYAMAMAKAARILSEGNAEFCRAEQKKVDGLPPYVHYSADDWERDDVWIRTKYDGIQDCVYLRKMSKESGMQKSSKRFEMMMKEMDI